MRVLISGASVAGPVLAYWLARCGMSPTVVERAPALRKTGGHAVDLFAPAVDIVERMGLLDRIQARETGTERLTMLRHGSADKVEFDLSRLFGATPGRHVEIMRDDLSEILYDATRDDCEYVFGDSITSIDDRGDGVRVAFEGMAARDFDLVIGADGLHSNVRRLVFGEEERYSAFIGGYIAVASVPNHLGLDGRMITMSAPNRLVGLYGARRMGDARAVFLFRTPSPLDYHHRDVKRQKELLREHYAGLGWEIPRLLDEADATQAFYFDSITQLRMDTWSRGRVSLVGDAGYCPGPAVGGGTSLAVAGAYVLAGELHAAGGDPARAFAAYERELADYVRGSRAFAVTMAERLVPATRAKVWLFAQIMRLMGAAPIGLARALYRRSTKGIHVHRNFSPKRYMA
ncbi:FAD-dependent monooxygenase [Spongiactinospora sp. TRM90649]|uniref:FAD-dependent monooxygenase n=1 Tax=Spongiactinospora sp. TRM90649 TaxID=3031114 RepID=UPI0023F87FCA|nr:FAD-dependent monooxygenase [Spongiactinospora sp. TRM90649]MDF5757192.1 FAD-dependent monooxygenase [Spongiactinospora sp. TRM90649]